MKKLVALFLALAMMMSLSIVFAEEHKEVTLTMSSIWSAETEANRAPFLKTLAEFEEAYPWIHIEMDWNEANAWKDKGENLALSDSLPDVFYWNAGGVLWNLVGSGDILALNDYLTDDIMARIEGGTLTDMTFDGKVYQLPYTKACSALYCNTELFDKYSVKIPETWDDLIEAVKAFKAAGVTPMTVGGSDQWPTNMYTDIIALRFAGDAACRACYYKTEGATFMTQDWLDGMSAFKELIDLGAFPADAASLTRDESEVAYFAGEIPMYVHGQWFAGSLSPEMQQKVKAVKFPTVAGKKTDNQWMGGAAEGFCVSSYTKNPDEAFILCQFLAENQSKNGFIAGAGLPAWKYDFSAYTDINPVLLQIVEATSNAESFLLWGNTALTGEDATLIGQTVYQVLAGEITPEQWCEDMETIFQ
ncbi:MAG: extracellular solute-binding protein [Clostridiales bacterium]|jgi:raffinose/stachyose/melibiose transport system substrate-binding protein|nr:extracellular solute-binding protein [Clostridiales bacterium]